MTAEKHTQIIEAIANKARSIVPSNAELILFGSRARGDAHEGSDWDILILLDKDRISHDDYDNFSYPFRELGWDLGQYINVVLFTKKGWQNDVASPFHENITEEGKLFDMRLTSDYSDRFDLVEDDVVPNIQPTEEFIVKVSGLAKEKLGINPEI